MSFEFANLALVTLKNCAFVGTNKEIGQNFFKEFAISWVASGAREFGELNLLLECTSESPKKNKDQTGLTMTTDAANRLRREMIEKTLATYKERGERKTLSIEYRGVDTALEVVRIHPKYLLLNHDNSRLSAQLMDHPKRSAVEKDPTVDSSAKLSQCSRCILSHWF